MFATVTIPVWLLMLCLLVPGVAVLDRLVGPPVRWYLRRRAERLIEELNKRLERPIQPFKLARRQDMILRLIYDHSVAEAVGAHARATGQREDVAFDVARRYAKEIVPSFSATAYFGIAIRLARWLSTRLFFVRVSHQDEEALAAIDPEAAVVFVMNHRSNMDYVLVTYLAAERSALSYAVGEWARVWPLSNLIRAMGAYFIRRRSRNPLYRRVLARYVQLATRAGVTQAIFPEGGLSQNGQVGEPKLGLLGYIVADRAMSDRDVVFVPVALNYDRVIEDRILVEAAARGQHRYRGTFRTGLAFAGRWGWRWATGKARRFGGAAVRFGSPLSLAAFAADCHGDVTGPLAEELMHRLRAQVPVLPVPLVAETLRAAEGRVPRAELLSRATARAAALRAEGRDLGDMPDPEMAQAGLDMLLLRRLVDETVLGVGIRAGNVPLVSFYAAAMPGASAGPGERISAVARS